MAAALAAFLVASLAWAQAPAAGRAEAFDGNTSRERLAGDPDSEKATSDKQPSEAGRSEAPLETRGPQSAVEQSTKSALSQPSAPIEAGSDPEATTAAPATFSSSTTTSSPSPGPAAIIPSDATPTVAPTPPPAEKAVTPSLSTAGTRNSLRLAVQPGAHFAAQQKAVHAPFVGQTGMAITVVPWPADGDPFKSARAGTPAWDVAEVDSEKARQACDAGLIERIDTAVLARSADGAAPEKDYISGGLTPCAVASVAWSSLIAFDQRAWPAPGQTVRGAKRSKAVPASAPRLPDKLKDVFDTAAFPGKRAFRRDPRNLLEMSLIADGVAPEDVYRVLASEDGTYRAFHRLEALRAHINWVDSPAGASKQLADRTAVMAMMYSGRAFQHVAVETKAYGLIWDGQLYRLSTWVVAKDAQQAPAHAFLRIVSDPAHMAMQATLFPYGPPRASAVAKVGRHPVLKSDMVPYLPTAPANLRTALEYDTRFWETHERRLTGSFEAWLKAPLAAPVPSTAPGSSGLPDRNSGPSAPAGEAPEAAPGGGAGKSG